MKKVHLRPTKAQRLRRKAGIRPGRIRRGALVAQMWTLMIAAMIFPSVAPTVSLYARTFRDNRSVRIAGLVVGYLAIWVAADVPTYGLPWLASWLTGMHPSGTHIVAVCAVCGIYQLSSLKGRCFADCRSSLGLLLHYGSYRGRSRDLRVGVHNGAYCLGCCWGLMVILIAVGVMNVTAMIGLAALVLVEKIRRWGPAAARLAGPAALARSGHHLGSPWPACRAADDDELTFAAETQPNLVTTAGQQGRDAITSNLGGRPRPRRHAKTGPIRRISRAVRPSSCDRLSRKRQRPGRQVRRLAASDTASSGFRARHSHLDPRP